MSRRGLVTGAQGLVGRQVVRVLASENRDGDVILALDVRAPEGTTPTTPPCCPSPTRATDAFAYAATGMGSATSQGTGC